jgi:hypothetical protein
MVSAVKRAICIGIGMLAFVEEASSAAGPTPAIPVGWAGHVTAPWSVSGVTLSMRPVDVAAALKVAGYVLDYRYMGRSWQGEVANQVSNLRGIRIPAGAEVISREDYRKGQEFIQVDYAPGPAGPYVGRVSYKIPTSAIDAERFRAAAMGRYGRPSLRGEWEDVYCSAGEQECSRIVSLVTNQFPSLTVNALDGTDRTIELRQGQRADLAFEAAVKAEAERLYPKQDKPSF